MIAGKDTKGTRFMDKCGLNLDVVMIAEERTPL